MLIYTIYQCIYQGSMTRLWEKAVSRVYRPWRYKFLKIVLKSQFCDVVQNFSDTTQFLRYTDLPILRAIGEAWSDRWSDFTNWIPIRKGLLPCISHWSLNANHSLLEGYTYRDSLLLQIPRGKNIRIVNTLNTGTVLVTVDTSVSDSSG